MNLRAGFGLGNTELGFTKGEEKNLQVPSTSFMSLDTSLSRRSRPKWRGWSCIFRSKTMWKNILRSSVSLLSSPLPLQPINITGTQYSRIVLPLWFAGLGTELSQLTYIVHIKVDSCRTRLCRTRLCVFACNLLLGNSLNYVQWLNYLLLDLILRVIFYLIIHWTTLAEQIVAIPITLVLELSILFQIYLVLY